MADEYETEKDVDTGAPDEGETAGSELWRYGLLHGDELMGVFSTREQADLLGCLKYGEGAYRILEVGAEGDAAEIQREQVSPSESETAAEPSLDLEDEPSADPVMGSVAASEPEMSSGDTETEEAIASEREETEETEETEEAEPASGDWPPAYERLRLRLQGFQQIPELARLEAWDGLLGWRNQLLNAHGSELPAPWVFVNEGGMVEMEWELTHCSLTLRRITSSRVEFRRIEPLYDRDEEETGTAEGERLLELLLRMIGR